MINLLLQALWIIVIIMIFGCGIYFCFKLRFIHLNFFVMIKAIREKSDKENSISAFESLTMSLAGRIGVGSLAGVALALYLGGSGVLFWIWVTSFLCATNTFAESVLSVVFRKKDFDNIYKSGPFYYIKEGLNNNKMAILYAFIVLIAYVGGFLTIQVNTISKCVNDLVQLNSFIIGIIIAFLTALTIFGGVKKIATTTSKLVPIMTFFYFIICLYIIISNINLIPSILLDIVNNALNFKAFGLGILSTLLIGMQKGIFSSEVGLGTGAIAAGTADTSSPSVNGLVQTFGIHIENIIIATLTVLVICTTNYQTLVINEPNGIELTIYAFAQHIGVIGPLFVVITIILFGLSSIIAGYYYGESSLNFIVGSKKIGIIILKILTLLLIVVGSVMSSNLLWSIVDVMVGIIAIINIYALFKLRKIVICEFKKYKNIRK